MSTFTLTAGYTWTAGDVVTATRLNTVPTIAAAQSYSFADGTAAAPSISFNSDSDNGFYYIGANNFGIACGGATIGNFSTTGLNNCAIGVTTPLAGWFTTLTSTGTGTGAGLHAVNSTGGTGTSWYFLSTDAGNCLIQQPGVVNALQLNFTTGNATFAGSLSCATGFGCNGKTPQTAYASGGVLANVVAALIANGILSS